MQVLLTTLNAKYIHLNLAVRLLYDLNKDYDNLHWKEYTIKEDPADIARECSQYELVCFSCYIWNITPTLKVCEAIKAINPTIKILLGGPEVSYEFEDIISKDYIDFIITGEGEIPFATFLKTYPVIDVVPNLVHKTNGHIHYNKRSVQFDLSLYENRNPYMYDVPEELYNKVCYVETSRGCPYKCEFCLASLDNKVRQLPIDTIKQQLLYLMQHGKTIKFLDRTFNIKKDFTIDMFQFILKHYQPHHVFQFEITADIVHPDIILFINEHVPKGLFRFEIGIQTVNKDSNLAVSRKQNFDKTAGVIKQLQDKIEMHLDLIVGLPLDYWEDSKYSFEQVFLLFPPELQLGFLKFLKGTPVREKYEQYEYVFDPLPPYQIIQSKFLCKEQLHDITLVEHALEIYWNKKRATHTLKYVARHYSIFDFFLSLGKFFNARQAFHRYTLKDVYTILFDMVAEEYNNDTYLPELITIDYYLQHKIKPAALFVNEINKKDKFYFIEKLSLNHHKNRYVAIPISFDWSYFLEEIKILPTESLAFIEYSAIEKPTVIAVNKPMNMLAG